jgi:hypothetical protein
MTCVNTLIAAECHDLPTGDGRPYPPRGLAIHAFNQPRAQRCGGKQRSTARQNRSSPAIAWAAIPPDAARRRGPDFSTAHQPQLATTPHLAIECLLEPARNPTYATV